MKSIHLALMLFFVKENAALYKCPGGFESNQKIPEKCVHVSGRVITNFWDAQDYCKSR